MKRLAMSVLLVVVALLFAGNIPIAHAGAPGLRVSVSTQTETFSMRPQMCMRLKRAMPSQANNPTLCRLRHTVVITTTTYNAPAACVKKTQSFDDEYTDYLSFDLYLATVFSWSGNCGKPSMRSGYPLCDIVELAGTLGSTSCTAYSPDYRSEAGLFSVYWDPYNIPFAWTTIWQRRQCYNDGNCDWHTDNG
ncbi:MAG TPA: hypothetical protein VKQ36_16610 [Ktedonobacterales bacterium]|nr:hypothetical protein [Ktedonobacterales bacterium]